MPDLKQKTHPEVVSGDRDFGREHVVLVHGLAANRLVMLPLAKRLRRQGFQTTNHGYWSSRGKIEQHSKRLAKRISKLHEDPAIKRIHLVTHSMGCIIGRHLMNQQKYKKIDRWVMLAPPNHGSHAADKLLPLLGRLLVPLSQLSESPDSFVNMLPDFRQVNDVDFAVLEAAYDHVISPNKVPLEGQSDYAVIKCMHGAMPFSCRAIDYVQTFLSK